jgi:ribosomal-protein-alanine N-acetyltransferase
MVVLERACPEAAQWGANAYAQLDTGAISGFGAEQGVELIAFIVVRIAACEMEILNLAVTHRTRRRGIATRLLAAALASGKERSAIKAFLEVRESNSVAREFYKSQGFQESGRRKSYYSHPYEDALVLSLPLTPLSKIM